MKAMFLFRAPALVLLCALFCFSRPAAAADSLSESQSLVLKSQAVFKSFMNDPGMTWFHENVGHAHGILIVPQMLRGGFIVGGSGGSGVLLVRNRKNGSWSYPAFYTVGSLSVGLQIGADASELVLMIMTEAGVNAMLSTELKVGADISVAAGPMGQNAKAQTADVLAFGRAKGAFGGLSVEGAVISPRNAWNSAYYGGWFTPMDVLVKRTARNPQAEALRSLMPGSRRLPQPQPCQSDCPDNQGYNQGYEFGYPARPLPPLPPAERSGASMRRAQDEAWRNPDRSWQNPDQSWSNPDQQRQSDWP
jgi:lipid-binding SYLF domain-containing protein